MLELTRCTSANIPPADEHRKKEKESKSKQDSKKGSKVLSDFSKCCFLQIILKYSQYYFRKYVKICLMDWKGRDEVTSHLKQLYHLPKIPSAFNHSLSRKPPNNNNFYIFHSIFRTFWILYEAMEIAGFCTWVLSRDPPTHPGGRFITDKEYI